MDGEGHNLHIVFTGIAFRDISSDALFPSIGMKKSGEHIKTNFGQFPFVFDIDRFVAVSVMSLRYLELSH